MFVCLLLLRRRRSCMWHRHTRRMSSPGCLLLFEPRVVQGSITACHCRHSSIDEGVMQLSRKENWQRTWNNTRRKKREKGSVSRREALSSSSSSSSRARHRTKHRKLLLIVSEKQEKNRRASLDEKDVCVFHEENTNARKDKRLFSSSLSLSLNNRWFWTATHASQRASTLIVYSYFYIHLSSAVFYFSICQCFLSHFSRFTRTYFSSVLR